VREEDCARPERKDSKSRKFKKKVREWRVKGFPHGKGIQQRRGKGRKIDPRQDSATSSRKNSSLKKCRCKKERNLIPKRESFFPQKTSPSSNIKKPDASFEKRVLEGRSPVAQGAPGEYFYDWAAKVPVSLGDTISSGKRSRNEQERI